MESRNQTDQTQQGASEPTFYDPNLSMHPQAAPLPVRQMIPQSVDSNSNAALYLTIGGLVGITAAAAIRWLNGGDFTILPDEQQFQEPEPKPEVTSIQTQTEPTEVPSQPVPDDSVQIEIAQQINRLVQAMALQDVSHQEDLTRQTQVMLLFAKLTDCKNELSKLREEIRTRPFLEDNWETRLEETLQSIDECLANNQVNNTQFLEMEEPHVPQLELKAALETLVRHNETNDMRVGCQLLYLYVVNVATHPRVPRYRKIFTSNESFRKVATLKGGKELLKAVGFEETNNTLEWLPSTNEGRSKDEELYMARLDEAASALGVLKDVRGNSSTDQVLAAALSASGLDKVSNSRSTTPPRPPLNPNTQQQAYLRTPQVGIGAIISPPARKKLPILTPTNGFSFTTPGTTGAVAPSPIVTEEVSGMSYSYDEITYYSDSAPPNNKSDYQQDGSFLENGTDTLWK